MAANQHYITIFNSTPSKPQMTKTSTSTNSPMRPPTTLRPRPSSSFRCISSPGRKLTVNANGSFGPAYVGKYGEFNHLVTMRPHHVLQLEKTMTDHICAVPLANGWPCRSSLRCSAHTLIEKIRIKRSRTMSGLLEMAKKHPSQAAKQRELIRLRLDFLRFWRNPRMEPPSQIECPSPPRTCSQSSCHISEDEEMTAMYKTSDELKKAYVRKISKNSSTRLLDFVACLHLRLRLFGDDETRLQEVVKRLTQRNEATPG